MHVLHAPTSDAPNREPYNSNSTALSVGWRGVRLLTNSINNTELITA